MTIAPILMGVLQIVIGLFVLGVLVLVHELGHFLVAKAFGIRVLAFSIGFGKPVVHFERGGTEYRICAIPFGGYVQMAAEHPEDDREGKSDEFPSKPIWQRACVAVAGPGANYVFAVLCLWIAFMAGVQQPLYLDRPVVGTVSDSSSAAAAGMLPGDIVTEIDGVPVSGWDDVEKVFTRIEPQYVFTVQRDGGVKSFTIPSPLDKSGKFPKHPTAGLLPAFPPVVGKVTEGSPAQQGGIAVGDSIVAIDGVPVCAWQQVSPLVSRFDTASAGLLITVLRGGERLSQVVRPRFDAVEKRMLLGIAPGTPPSRTVRSGPVEAIPKAVHRSWEIVGEIWDVLGKLVNRAVSPRQLAGPIGIVQMSGGVAFMGIVPVLNFLALLGVNLALLNLLPLIITDGGLLLFLLVEAIRRKPLELKYQLAINRVAWVMIIGLFLFVTFNDVGRIPDLFRMMGK